MQGLLIGAGIILLLVFNATHLYLWISMLDDLKRELPEGVPLVLTWNPLARVRYQRSVLRLHRQHFPTSRKPVFWLVCWGLALFALVTVAIIWFR